MVVKGRSFAALPAHLPLPLKQLLLSLLSFLLSHSSSVRRHEGWVTSIATPIDNSDILLSSSRDKTVILWNLTREEGSYGFPQRSLRGHSHFVQDVVISFDGQFALSASWDK